MAALALLPDVARLVSSYLRGRPEVAALAAGRVYTVYPSQVDKSATTVLVQRIGGEPVLSRPLVVDLALLQLDASAGKVSDALELLETCRAVLVELEGEQPNGAGNVAGVTFGPARYVPDEGWRPPKARYVADLSVTVKPSATVLAGVN